MSNQEKQFRATLMRGLRWSAIKRFGQAFMSIIVTVIMARLLTPSDFGLVAMATVFTGISNVFTELGTGEALIRKKDPSKEFISSVFWLNTGLSLIVCFILAVIASSIAGLYGEEIVEVLIYVLSIEIFLSGLNRVSHALLEKNMRFKAIAFAQITSQICGSIIGISMAILGYGLWSLVFLGISGQLIYTILVNITLKWRPAFSFNIDHIKNIFSFSSYLTLNKILDHTQRRSEIFIVVYLLGTHLGGVYSQTYNLMRKPVKLISGFMAPVLFSSMSSFADDIERIKSLYLKSIQSFIIVYIPVSCFLILYSKPFVLFVLGEQWSEMGELIPVFGIMMLYMSVHKCNTIALKSIGRVDLLFKMYAVFLPVSILGCIIGSQFGIFWVAVSMSVSTFALFIASTITSMKVIKLSFSDFLVQIRKLFLYGLIVFVLGYFLNICLISYYDVNNIIPAILGIIFCSSIYISLIMISPVPAYYHFLELINIKRKNVTE